MKAKAFIIPINELTPDIILECLKASKPNYNYSEQYVQEIINHIHKNNDGTKAIIFYKNTKPKSCENYPDVDWETERQKAEWQEDEGL